MTINVVTKQKMEQTQPASLGGLPVRTHLRAGLAWDDVDDQAKALWGKLTSAVSGVTSSTPSAATTATTPTPAA
ncbi:MAG: hypothetical protein NT075_03970 [Chloroflexi bacterium]|nr:hypothetical protein [Chloroflexota bacterium]